MVVILCLGCGKEAASPAPPPPPPPPLPPPESPLALPVLGHGVALERYTAEVAAGETLAYTTTWGYRVGDTVGAPAHAGNAVKIWNVAGGTPILRDSIIITDAFTLGDVQISDDGRLLVVATDGSVGSIVIFDLSDPARPTELARFFSPQMPDESHTATLARVDGRLYAFLAAVPNFVIVDLSDPAHPTEVYGDSLGTSWVHDTFVRDGVLFACQWNGGLTLCPPTVQLAPRRLLGACAQPQLISTDYTGQLSLLTFRCTAPGEGTLHLRYQEGSFGTKIETVTPDISTSHTLELSDATVTCA